MQTETTEAKTKSYMAQMGKEGDTKVEWDADNAPEVEAAKRQFDYLTREKSYLAFKTKKDGSKGDQIRTFDHLAERIILVPPMVGG